MTVKFRHLRLRAETSDGPFGADIPLTEGLNILWADNTKGKSTCMQGLLYALGLEKMLGPRREIPLTYVMTSHLDDPETGQRHTVLESSVWVELENSASEIVTVRRGVVSSANRKLVSVFDGPLLTEPAKHYRQRDYFVLDPGAATRDAGFHRMLAEFLGWTLPIVRRYDGRETMLYLETIFPLLYVEQKAGWSSLPAAFPTYLQIRDVGRRAVEFVLALDTHELELGRQQIDLDLAVSKAEWGAKRDELLSIARSINARVEGIPSTPTISVEAIEQAHLLVIDRDRWHPLNELASLLRSRIADLYQVDTPSVEEIASEAAIELEQLTEKVAEQNALRNTLFRARQNEIAQKGSIELRIAALDEDLQKNRDALKLRNLGSTIAETFAAEHCPTCAQPITDTLLAQHVSAEVMSIEENTRYIQAQLDIFKQLRDHSTATIEALNRQLAAATANVNEISAHIRALKADLLAPANSPSVAALEKRIRTEARLQALDDAQQRFELQKAELISIAAHHAELLANRSKLPSNRLSAQDKTKLDQLQRLIREQANAYGFSTFPTAELEISEETYRPQKEGFEIGFELSASDAIRLKWAYQLALLELDRTERTNHPGFVIFDEPRQQSAKTHSLKRLLERASTAKAAGQQVIFATSEDRSQLETFLSDVDCHYLPYDGYILQRL